MQYAVGVSEGFDSCCSDGLRGRNVAGVWRGFVEFDEGAEDYALIVGPDCSVVVVAGGVETVVDEGFGVYHSGVLEPGPLALGDGEVGLLVAGHAVCEVSGNAQVELVRNGVHVGVFLVPPYPSSAFGGAAVLHVVEDVDCCVEILGRSSDVVCLDPTQRPPSFIVVIAIEKSFGVLLPSDNTRRCFCIETLDVEIWSDNFGHAKIVVLGSYNAVGVHGADLGLD